MLFLILSISFVSEKKRNPYIWWVRLTNELCYLIRSMLLNIRCALKVHWISRWIQKALIHPPPLPQALFSVDVGLISKSGLKSFNIRPLWEHSWAQNTLNRRYLLFSQKRSLSSSFFYITHEANIHIHSVLWTCSSLRIFSPMRSMQPATGSKRKGDASGERKSLWADGTFWFISDGSAFGM